jgi:hypothetical protein
MLEISTSLRSIFIFGLYSAGRIQQIWFSIRVRTVDSIAWMEPRSPLEANAEDFDLLR